MSHWLIAASVLASWLTRHARSDLHDWLGYLTLVLVLLRLGWGFWGPRPARLASFVRSPANTIRYASSLLKGNAPRYIGHNPLGGWMAVSLWSLIIAVCVTGWMYTTDRWWGIAWVGDTHIVLTNVLLAMVAAHILGVVFASRHQHENLAASMLHGRKRPASGDDVE